MNTDEWWRAKLLFDGFNTACKNIEQLVKGNVRYRKFRPFSSCEFWKNIGCLVLAPTFGIGGSRLWEKEEEQKLS